MAHDTPLDILSINCQGIKSNLNYIKYLLNNECDIMFVCEPWLKPCDLVEMNSIFRNDNLWCNLKSSIPADQLLAGRPYGGVGFICRKPLNCNIREIPQNDDRISVIQIINNGQIRLTVVGAYLPFFSGTSCEKYNETLDKIHAITDAADSLVILLGDMNAQLPQQPVLSVNWYKQRPFNKHSVFLHDFLGDHNMISANFHYKQNMNYTYFSGTSRSYIDHIFVSENTVNQLNNCTILPHHVDNVGDHLPLKVNISLSCKPSCTSSGDVTLCRQIKNIDWSKQSIREQFVENIKKYTVDINNTNVSNINDSKSAQQCVNELNNGIITTICKACADTTAQGNTQSTEQTSKSRSTPWWTNSTQIAKNRKSLWYSIWSSCDKPRDGYVYVCYKLAKTKYRQACRLAFNTRVRSSFHRLNFLYNINDSKKFWNIIRKCRRATNDPSSDIALSSLVNYYSEKFSMSSTKSNTILTAEQFVYERQQELSHVTHNAGFTVQMVSKYIHKLKRNSAPAADGITAEHLIYCVNSDIIRYITNMLTLCVQFGVVPDSFTNGLLIPIPKKAGCDTSIPKNWRPIVISTTLSKILEMYVLEESNTHEFNDLQFGFIPGRGTEIATALLNDVTSYCNTRGSAVYTCSLDAEGAFDAIPHSILFYKAATVLPKHCWHVMHTWYSKLTVQVKWCGTLSSAIKVSVGTRQGGLSSPFLFNLFYQDFISLLSNYSGGITIHNDAYNVFCYADDLIIASLSVTGLQEMIYAATSYIVDHGLNFNPAKTICKTFGSCNFKISPKWYINDCLLTSDNSVTYLGTTLTGNVTDHIDTRIKSARRAYYGLQGAGVCCDGVASKTLSHIYKVAIQPILTYGCAAISIDNRAVKSLEKTQGMLLKTALGIPKNRRNSPLLAALGIEKIEQLIKRQQLTLLRNALQGNSRARTFYMGMMKLYNQGNIDQYPASLLSRCKKICDSEQFSLYKYIFNDKYQTQ